MRGDKLQKLDRDFYEVTSLELSKKLLGKYLIHEYEGQKLSGMIVETEAYMGPHDKAAHSYNNRRTERNEVMYGQAGYAYVYIIYGMYNCMNVVASTVNVPQAVLIRALEPADGENIMALNRFGKSLDELSKKEKINLTNGPGKLCRALNIDRSLNGEDLCGNNLYIAGEMCQNEICNINEEDIVTTKRINIDYAEEAVDFPWRFYIKGNKYVSKK